MCTFSKGLAEAISGLADRSSAVTEVNSSIAAQSLRAPSCCALPDQQHGLLKESTAQILK